MEVNPPRWLSTIVRLLVPPVCREHVLGDLQERLQTARSRHGALAYLWDALQTVPFVIWSQVRRGIHPTFLPAQAFLLYGAFVSGAFYVYGGAAPAFLTARHGVWLVAVPTLVSLLVLMIADAYNAYRESVPPHFDKVAALALGIAGLVNEGTRYIAPHWAVPTGVLLWGALVSLPCTAALRYFRASEDSRDRLAAAGPDPSPDIQTRAHRLAQGMSRRTQMGSVVLLFLVAAFGRLAVIAVNPLQRIGACLTVAACLYVAYQLRLARPAPLPADRDRLACLQAYRSELERQRDFHGGPSFWWRSVVLIPGYFLLLGGLAMAHPAGIHRVAMIGVTFLLFGGLAIPLNRRVARRYQQQLDDLHEDHVS